MSKRYAFWRGPDGRPYTGPDSKNAPTELLAQIGISTSINAEGQLSWEGFIFSQLEVGLRMVFVVVSSEGEELNEPDGWSIARGAIIAECHRIGGRKPIEPSKLLQQADKLAAKYFQHPEESYVLIGSLSVGSFPKKSISIGGCRIRVLNSRADYPLPDSFSRLGPQAVCRLHAENTKYRWVAVTTKGRSINEGFQRAASALNLLRSLWILSATYGRWSISFGSGGSKPLAVVHTGPFHTLHRPGGALVNKELYWQENDARPDRELFIPSGGWDRLEKNRQMLQRRISRLPYRTDFEDLAQRYVAALDQVEHDLAFLQMWAILEKITNTIGAKYDETIRRVTWILKNRGLGEAQLRCVRIQRNRYVHAAHSSGQGDQAAYLIKSYLDPHLRNLLFNEYKVNSLPEYADVLSLPTDVVRLKKIRKWVSVAIDLHTSREEKTQYA